MKFTNLAGLKTPGVYVREVSIFPPSIAQVPTAIPAFIGYTEKAEELNKDSLLLRPWRISSMKEYTQFFGGSPKSIITRVDVGGEFQVIKSDIEQDYLLYDCLQLYFANGGGDCYIVSVGDFNTPKSKTAFENGLDVLYEVDEPTMLVFPDAAKMAGDDLYDLQKRALKQCDEMMDRVTICDLKLFENKTDMTIARDDFRNKIGMASLKYGAAYGPWVKSSIRKDIKFRDIVGKVFQFGGVTPLDFKLLTSETSVKTIIDELSQIIADSNTIDTKVKGYTDTVDADLWPAGSASKFADIREGFSRLSASVQALVNIARADTSVAGNMTNARNEYKKAFRQNYKLLQLLDSLLSPGITTNVDFKTKVTAGIAQLQAQIEKMVKLDNTTGTTATATIDEPVGSITNYPLRNGFTAGLNAGGTIATALALTATDLVIYTNFKPGATAPGRLAQLDNIMAGMGALSEVFANVIAVIEQLRKLTKDTEKVKEDSLLQQLPPFKTIIDALNKTLTKLPPSAVMAGIYARVDNDLGVWNAPANVSINEVAGLSYNLTDKDQEDFNVDVNAGKSINIIRSFTGMGMMVWGARTLAGNDNEWRYVPVRRFFNMVEESVMKSTKWAVFKPNDANLWIKVKGMIDNYLTLLWRQGALAGAKPEEAFFCRVGLNQTMTSVDILEGRLIVQIGMAVVRPAEFIILEFSHKLQTS